MQAGARGYQGAANQAANQFAAHALRRRTARARRDERRTKFARFAIAFSLFLALLAAALLVGGNGVIDPLLQSVVATRDAKPAGEILFSLPDGAFCRHLSFDNATAELTAGEVEPCPHNLAGKHERAGFAWGGR